MARLRSMDQFHEFSFDFTDQNGKSTQASRSLVRISETSYQVLALSLLPSCT